MSGQNSILIVGASARHIAQSAKIAGLQPFAIDLFADWDLQQVAEIQQVESLSEVAAYALPNQSATSLNQFLICGGMETRDEVLAKLESQLKFCGPSLKQLSRTQDPFLVNQICNSNRIQFPQIRRFNNPPEPTERWLAKPLLGSGGHQIAMHQHTSDISPDHFLQRYVSGASYSASFSAAAAKNKIQTELLGITRQLVGQSPFTGIPFAYCGSIGPVQLSHALHEEIARAGACIAQTFELSGCFGIDFVVDEYSKPWLIEINPRITASAEILELAGCIRSIVDIHLRSYRGEPTAVQPAEKAMIGKAIAYSSFAVPVEINEPVFEFFRQRSLLQQPNLLPKSNELLIADIPTPGTIIKPGRPIVSVFTTGETVEITSDRLATAAKEVAHQIKRLADLKPASH